MGKLARLLSPILIFSLFSPLAAKEIKIGIAGPFSGPYASFGEQFWQGVSLAANDINAQGGVNGDKIVLIKGDDACEPKQAVAVANRFVHKDKINAIIGHFCSSSTIPASEIYNDAHLLMITPAATNPLITERGLKTIFRTCGRDDQQGIIAADFIVQKLKANKIAVLHDKDTYGKGLANATKSQLEKLGAQIALFEGITRGEKDFNAVVTKIKQANVQAVYFGGMHTEAGPLVRQMHEQGLDIPFISGDGIVAKSFATEAGGPKMVSNVYMTFGQDPREIPAGQKVVAALRKAGYEPEGYTLYVYATLQIIAKAMSATQTTDGSQLADWLRQNTVATIMGDKAWDPKGDLKKSDYVIYRWNEQGTYQRVE